MIDKGSIQPRKHDFTYTHIAMVKTDWTGNRCLVLKLITDHSTGDRCILTLHHK